MGLKPRKAPTPKPPLTSQQKGRLLEDAVEMIEAAILRNSPGIRDFQFKIEPRKIVMADGVRHEIDLFVTVTPAAGYESVIIFECKNWNEKASPAEVIQLAEKVHVTGAQRGYLVAPDFTKYAVAQAKKTPRVELLQATFDAPPTIFDAVFAGIIAKQSQHTHVRFGMRGGEATAISISDAAFQRDGSTISGTELVNSWARSAMDEQLPSTEMMSRYAFRPTGTYPQPPAAQTLSFEPGELTIDGREALEAEVRVDFAVVVGRPICVVDVSGRGRSVTAELPGTGVRASLIQAKPT